MAILHKSMEYDAEYGTEFAETTYAYTSSGEVKLVPKQNIWAQLLY